MSVVENFLSNKKKAPIYTVHDNFITTVLYSRYIPILYGDVIRNMGPPLSIINEFIYLNVIKPIVKRESYGPTAEYYKEMVIPKEKLHYYLMQNIPENISNKMRKTWEERISGILTSYENYTRNVCGNSKSTNPRACFQAHELMWEKFWFQIKKHSSTPYYCVHY